MTSATMLLVLMLCFASVSWVVAKPTQQLGDEGQWEAWKKIYGKSYKDKYEEKYRKAIWMANLEKIMEHNKAGHTFTLGMNQFGDLTLAEYRYFMLGAKYPGNSSRSGGSTFLRPSNVKLPVSVDWRTKGYVTPVKNQAQCGSCWAFSSTGALEGQHFKKTGNLVSLSEQNLLDCCQANQGCNGGWINNAFSYIKTNNGIDTEASYPYQAIQQPYCYFKSEDVGATDTGFISITAGSELDLQIAVATIGPISVAIDASHQSFELYRGGVYYEPKCSSTWSNHAMLVVGYGTMDDRDYWLVKNSWATWWGMDGYIMMARNCNNQCGIATAASYPLV